MKGRKISDRNKNEREESDESEKFKREPLIEVRKKLIQKCKKLQKIASFLHSF